MHTPIKLMVWLLAATGALLTLLVALLLFVDVNLYRDRIERQVSAAFGREVVFTGPLSLERSLTPRFAVKGLKISNPAWASRPFLATVDSFGIRVSLLPLLGGELEIVALEFHGVDLLLEKAPDGNNNFTFGASGDKTALPAIKHMSLHDAAIAYASPDAPLRRLHMERVTARKVPGQPVELELQTAVNRVPVTISARGEPPGVEDPHAPWRVTLLGEAGDLSLRLEGSLADPSDWSHGEYRLDLQGGQLDDLESLSGYTLPDAEPVELGANIRFKLDEYLEIGDLAGQIGSSDIHGNLHWDMAASPPVIRMRLASQRLDARELGLGDPPTGNPDQHDRDYLDEPLDTGALAAVDLDIEARVQRLEGLAKTVQDVELTAQADRQQLRLASVKATLDDTHIAASALLPWGERLTRLAPGAVSARTLLQHAELDIRAHPLTAYRYATTLAGRPLDLALSGIEATARPDEALTIRAEAALNDKPLSVSLRAEPLASILQRPTGPWNQLVIEARGDEIRLDASGSVARPFQAEGLDVEYAMSGPDIATLLPLKGAWSLSGHYSDQPDRHLFDQLALRVGRSDVDGRIAIHRDGQRTRLVARLDADRIDVNEITPDDTGNTQDATAWDRPLELGELAALELDTEVRIQRLEGVAKPVQDIRLDAVADARSLTLAPLQATLDGTRLAGRLQLPWGERLNALGKDGMSIRRLVQLAHLDLEATPPRGKLQHRALLMGHPLDIELAGLEASARPGKALKIRAEALLDNAPIQAELQAETLAQLLQRPAGPWQDLALQVKTGGFRLQATGRVERPFEASGFDIRYALRGAEVNELLPVFNLVLPLEGAYSLTGRFVDHPDRRVFDELKIESGDNDISGDISVYQGEQRPRVVANFRSEQIYLGKLLPVSETVTTPGAKRRVIPDYDLPIERMREFDGELSFRGERLRTNVGDLGDVSFRAILKDGVFRMDPFRVRGWAGAYIESDGLIDASQEPPFMQWNWIARQLNYGVLLEQAGLAETVKGTIDVTLRLSGHGRTRHEFLSDADGRLIIVGREGRFGSRRLDLWGSALVTTMLSPEWHSQDVTDLNCIVARIRIEDGVASSDKFIVDTNRITIAATGSVDLESEALNLIFAPRPKRATLLSLASPVHVTGTLAAPEVAVTVLPRNRMAAAGTGMLAGLINPGYLIFAFSQTGPGQANACEAAVAEAMALKGTQDQAEEPSAAEQPRRFSLFPGCTRQRSAQ